jgi:6-phosphogluconolactonase
VPTRTLIVLAERVDVITRVAHDTRRLLVATLAESPFAHIVLTGGTVGIGVLSYLGANDGDVPEGERVDWSRVHLWWGDDRWVSAAHEDRNDAQVEVDFLDALSFVPKNIHRIPASDSGMSLDESAKKYATELAIAFPQLFSGRTENNQAQQATFDLVFLGVGPDAHVASLFPGRAGGLTLSTPVIPVRDSPKAPPERISLTLGAINSAKHVWLVLAGVDKANALKLAMGKPDFSRAPASAVEGTFETRVYCDENAWPSQEFA